MSLEHVRTDLASTPDAIAWLCRGLTDAQANRSLDGESWTFFELMIHLWDYELEIRKRAELMATEESPHFTNWDEKEHMARREPALTVSRVLNEFRQRREDTITLVDRLGETGLAKQVVMPSGETISGLDYLKRVARHDRNHLGAMVKIHAQGV